MSDPKSQRKQDDASEGNVTSQDKKAEAESLKTRGNQSLKAQDFTEAIRWYGKAIELDPNNHVYYSNRSAAYSRSGKYKEALVDAEKCIEIHAAWARGYGRKGAALFGQTRYAEAIEAYKTALRFEPQSAHYKNEIEQCKSSQKGKTTPRASSSNWMKSILSHSIFYAEFMGHLFLIFCAIMSLLPTVGARRAYKGTLLLAAILQTTIVMKRHGRPKFNKRYWLEVLKNDQAHFILAAFLCMMSRPFFLGVAGHVMRSALFIATGLQDLILRGPRILSPLNQPIIMNNLKKLTNLQYKVYDLVASMEVIIGFMLIIEMATPGRNFFLLFAWWQYLRTRYVLSGYSKSAFAQIRYKLDEWLLHSSWCPSVIGTVYTKIKSFCARSASPEAQSSSRCSVM